MKPQNTLLGPLVAAGLVIILITIAFISLDSEADRLREDAAFWRGMAEKNQAAQEEALIIAERWKGLYEEMAVIARTLVVEPPTPRLRLMSEADRERFSQGIYSLPKRATDTTPPPVESK